MVCGAANNQLVDTGRDGRALSERGVLFVPEIVTNRMGVVHCANEQYGTPRHDPAVERHLSDGWEDAIGPVVRRVLARAESDGVPPVEAANALADEAASRPHPLWPGRGAAILHSLVEERWHER
jgi:glutamate dehydrogenase/leucine dehydrogenase